MEHDEEPHHDVHGSVALASALAAAPALAELPAGALALEFTAQAALGGEVETFDLKAALVKGRWCCTSFRNRSPAAVRRRRTPSAMRSRSSRSSARPWSASAATTLKHRRGSPPKSAGAISSSRATPA